MPRTLTPRQRIEALHDDSVIDAQQYYALLTMERETREGIRQIFAPLTVTANDFFARNEGVVECNARRQHRWFESQFNWDYKPIGGNPEVQTCDRCGMRKVDVYTKGGRKNGSTRYFPPEEYSLEGLAKKLTGQDRYILRLHHRLRLMLTALEADPSLASLERAAHTN